MDKRVYGTRGIDYKWSEFYETSINTPGYYTFGMKKLVEPIIKSYSVYRTDFSCSGLPQTGWHLSEDIREVATAGGARKRSSGRYVDAEPSADLMTRATNRLVDKVRNTQIDLGVALGEYKETAALFTSAARNLPAAVKALRRGNLSMALTTFTGHKNLPTLKDVADVASNTYLFMTYGVAPLVRDIFTACEVLENRWKDKPDIRSIRTTLKSDFRYLRPDTFGRWGTGVGLKQGKIKRTASARLVYVVDNPVFKTLDECGVLNPLSIAWELVPLSFVVDWFIPVGKFLSNVVPPQGVRFMKGYTLLKGEGQIESSDYDYVFDSAPSWCKSTGIWKERTLMTSMPSYQVRLEDLSLTKGQIASSVALLWQKRKAMSRPVTNAADRLGHTYTE